MTGVQTCALPISRTLYPGIRRRGTSNIGLVAGVVAMMWRIDLRIMSLLILGLAVAGCATAPPSGERSSSPFARERTPLTALPATPAVAALLDDADISERAGDFERTAAALERALRLEPLNAMLWHRLARVRLKQGQWQNAVEIAAKSNSLAGEDQVLQQWNWAVIAEAKERLGDSSGADAARAHLNAGDKGSVP